MYIDNNIVQFSILEGKASVAEFITMLNDFKICYQPIEKEESSNAIYYTQLKTDAEISKYRNRSIYTKWLFDRVKENVRSK